MCGHAASGSSRFVLLSKQCKSKRRGKEEKFLHFSRARSESNEIFQLDGATLVELINVEGACLC